MANMRECGTAKYGGSMSLEATIKPIVQQHDKIMQLRNESWAYILP